MFAIETHGWHVVIIWMVVIAVVLVFALLYGTKGDDDGFYGENRTHPKPTDADRKENRPYNES